MGNLEKYPRPLNTIIFIYIIRGVLILIETSYYDYHYHYHYFAGNVDLVCTSNVKYDQCQQREAPDVYQIQVNVSLYISNCKLEMQRSWRDELHLHGMSMASMRTKIYGRDMALFGLVQGTSPIWKLVVI